MVLAIILIPGLPTVLPAIAVLAVGDFICGLVILCTSLLSS